MKGLIVYSSLTGNTKKIAEAIYEAIPFEKEIYSEDENYDLDQYDVIIIGYWLDKGMCNKKIKEIIEKLENKDIVLFGTLGARDKGEYYESIKKKIEAIIPESNKMLGHFLCQGKIDERLTEKYKEMIKESPNAEHIKEQLKNHYEAASHPDLNDLQMAKDFISNNLFSKNDLIIK
jgi:flavodoxin